MYKVTLSMPIYNVAPYVERALLSALNQTFDSIEFLIVDDKGTDNSMEIVRKIVSEHPRGKDVRIIEHPHNIGTGATKNTAIDNAQGKYLFFMDSDDEIIPDCIEILYKFMLEEPVNFIAASFDKKLPNGKIEIGQHYKNISFKDKYSLSEYYFSREGHFVTALWNKLYDIQFLKKNNIRCFPHHLCEDFTLLPDILLNSTSSKLLSNVTLLYTERIDSTIGDMNNNGISLRQATEFVEAIEYHFEKLNMIHLKSLYIGYSKFLIKSSFDCLCKIVKSNKIEISEKNKLIKRIKLKSDLLNSFIIIFNIKVYMGYLMLKFPYCVQKKIINLYL